MLPSSATDGDLRRNQDGGCQDPAPFIGLHDLMLFSFLAAAALLLSSNTDSDKRPALTSRAPGVHCSSHPPSSHGSAEMLRHTCRLLMDGLTVGHHSACQHRQEDPRAAALCLRGLQNLHWLPCTCRARMCSPLEPPTATQQHRQAWCSPHGRADFGDQLAGAGARRQVPHPDVARRIACKSQGFRVRVQGSTHGGTP